MTAPGMLAFLLLGFSLPPGIGVTLRHKACSPNRLICYSYPHTSRLSHSRRPWKMNETARVSIPPANPKCASGRGTTGKKGH